MRRLEVALSQRSTKAQTMNNALKPHQIPEESKRITHAVKHGVSISWGVRAVHENGRLASIANGVTLELFESVTIPEYYRETVLHAALNDQSNLNALTGLCHDFGVIKRDAENARAPAPTQPIDHINITWGKSDVRQVWGHATDEQCAAVLTYIKARHDATIGVTWDVVDDACDAVRNA